MIFLDASVLLAAEDLDDSNHAAAVALLRTGALGTLDLVAYEVANVAETRWRDPHRRPTSGSGSACGRSPSSEHWFESIEH